IDQHARQLTVSLRDQQGDVLLARQVPIRPAKILQFFDKLTQLCAEHNESFIAVLEVCGFNDWLIS
ncbi:MAG TPA: IS110 family transposase, partial [Planctomycetaceae bacterium]|nr:IS110 family transposase [Planctomycetaceae bacterium]